MDMNCRDVGKISFAHFQRALTTVLPSVTPERLKQYELWHQERTKMAQNQANQLHQQNQQRPDEEDKVHVVMAKRSNSGSSSHPPAPSGPPPASVIERARAQGTLSESSPHAQNTAENDANCGVQ